MKHITILLLHHINLGGLENARQGFVEANNYLAQQGKPPAFNIQVAGLGEEVTINNGMYTLRPDVKLSEITKTDLIVFPPVQQDIQQAIEKNKEFLPWVVRQYQNGAQVASLCLGAFVLASTGLLDGRQCVTHWKAEPMFRSLFPNVHLVPEKLLTDCDGIYTGGGAFSSANLVLYLLEKNLGREAAVYCSKVFQIDIGRNSQSPFIIFTGQKGHGDEEIRLSQLYIEENFHEKITVENLSSRFKMGRRTFERRFKKATGNTIIEYMQRVKIEAAKRQLEGGAKTISEVMYDVGYSDTKAFRDVFKKISGISPTDYRNRFIRTLTGI